MYFPVEIPQNSSSQLFGCEWHFWLPTRLGSNRGSFQVIILVIVWILSKTRGFRQDCEVCFEIRTADCILIPVTGWPHAYYNAYDKTILEWIEYKSRNNSFYFELVGNNRLVLKRFAVLGALISSYRNKATFLNFYSTSSLSNCIPNQFDWQMELSTGISLLWILLHFLFVKFNSEPIRLEDGAVYADFIFWFSIALHFLSNCILNQFDWKMELSTGISSLSTIFYKRLMVAKWNWLHL